MENEYTRRAITVAVLASLASLIMWLLCGCTCVPDTRYQELKTMERYAVEQTTAHGLHAHLLHRIWIDNPEYVEDVLSQTPEFCELEEFLEGDFEDTFCFWTEEDSLRYYQNKARHRPAPKDPDTIPSRH